MRQVIGGRGATSWMLLALPLLIFASAGEEAECATGFSAEAVSVRARVAVWVSVATAADIVGGGSDDNGGQTASGQQ